MFSSKKPDANSSQANSSQEPNPGLSEEERKKLETKGRTTHSDFVQIYMIEIEIKKAEDLIKADVFGLSDPYCEATMFGQTYKTKTIMKNLNPIWNEKTVFAFFEDPEFIQFKVWDWDKGSKDDPIGDYKFPLKNFFDQGHNGFDGKVKLENVKKGELFIKVKCKKMVPSELEQRLRDLQNDIDNQTKKITEQKANIDTLTVQKNNVINENNNIQQQNDKLQNTKKSLQDDISALRFSENEYNTQLKNAENERLIVEKEYNDIENVRNDKNSKLTAIKNDVRKLEDEIKNQLNDELQNLKKQYQTKQENDKVKQESDKAKQSQNNSKQATKNENAKDEVKQPLNQQEANHNNNNNNAAPCQCCVIM